MREPQKHIRQVRGKPAALLRVQGKENVQAEADSGGKISKMTRGKIYNPLKATVGARFLLYLLSGGPPDVTLPLEQLRASKTV